MAGRLKRGRCRTTTMGSGEGKAATGKVAMDKAPHTHKGASKASGAVNVVSQQSPPRLHSPSCDISSGRRCHAQFQIECDGDHVVLQCAKLQELDLDERRKVLEKSGLCMYCLKHAAELECLGQGDFSKPRCTQPGCGGKHVEGAHKQVMGIWDREGWGGGMSVHK
jgi:hypothetical protein